MSRKKRDIQQLSPLIHLKSEYQHPPRCKAKVAKDSALGQVVEDRTLAASAGVVAEVAESHAPGVGIRTDRRMAPGVEIRRMALDRGTSARMPRVVQRADLPLGRRMVCDAIRRTHGMATLICA